MKDEMSFHSSAYDNRNVSDSSPAALKGLRILAVDDEADVRELMRSVLEPYGARVSVAATAQEALIALDQSKPDLLLCDIGMPDVDGYMLIRQVRSRSSEQGGKIPAIALTAYADRHNQTQALIAGFQLHLAKPIETEELVRAIALQSIHFTVTAHTKEEPTCLPS